MQMRVYPFLAEMFHNHNGTVIKCYAVEEKVFIRAKPSIPDLPWSTSSRGQSCGTRGGDLQWCSGQVAFHTLMNMPCAEPGSVQWSLAEDPLTVRAAQLCAAAIRAATGLTLFGFDLTRPSAANTFLLVDVNAFPSFKEISGAAEALREMLKHRCKRE
jgi:hypothetical protein